MRGRSSIPLRSWWPDVWLCIRLQAVRPLHLRCNTRRSNAQVTSHRLTAASSSKHCFSTIHRYICMVYLPFSFLSQKNTQHQSQLTSLPVLHTTVIWSCTEYVRTCNTCTVTHTYSNSEFRPTKTDWACVRTFYELRTYIRPAKSFVRVLRTAVAAANEQQSSRSAGRSPAAACS